MRPFIFFKSASSIVDAGTPSRHFKRRGGRRRYAAREALLGSFRTALRRKTVDLPGFRSPANKAGTQLAKLLLEFFLGTYHERVHSETKMAPAQRWEKGAFLPRMPKSLEQLDLLLLTVAKAQKVHHDGIHFLELRYLGPDLGGVRGRERNASL
jgi:hypothetical protein